MEPSRLKRISTAFGLAWIILYGGFWIYLYEYAPRVPIEASNRIYAVNNHGAFLYLNKTEYITLYAIPITFLLIGVVSAIVMKIQAGRHGDEKKP